MTHSTGSVLQIINGKLLVRMVGFQAKGLQNALSSINSLDVVDCFHHTCSEFCPLHKLPAIAKLPSVQFVQAVQVLHNIGSVTSKGNAAMYSNHAHWLLGINEMGINIGVISDLFNYNGGTSKDIAMGNLPPNGVHVIQKLSLCMSRVNEGCAMLQIIHDTVPGANLAFHPSSNSPTDMIAAMQDLVATGCHIIVDDLTYFDKPFFQDGLIAQSANNLITLNNIAYFTSVGN